MPKSCGKNRDVFLKQLPYSRYIIKFSTKTFVMGILTFKEKRSVAMSLYPTKIIARHFALEMARGRAIREI